MELAGETTDTQLEEEEKVVRDALEETPNSKVDEGPSDIDKLIVELNIEERERKASVCLQPDDPNDNDFQKILAHQLDSARKALAVSHTQVLNLVAQKIEVGKYAEECIKSLRKEKEELQNEISHSQRDVVDFGSVAPKAEVFMSSDEVIPTAVPNQVMPPDPPMYKEQNDVRLDTRGSDGEKIVKTSSASALGSTTTGNSVAKSQKAVCVASESLAPLLSTNTSDYRILPTDTSDHHINCPTRHLEEVGTTEDKAHSNGGRKRATIAGKRTSNFSTSTDGSRNVVAHEMSELLLPAARRNFTLLPCWEKNNSFLKNEMSVALKNAASMEAALRHSLSSGDVEWEDPDDIEKLPNGSSHRIIFNPNSPYRVMWDVVSLLMVVFDMVFIPLQLLEPPENAFELVLSWIARLFWTSDIPMSFFTGYIRADGAIVMSPLLIARRYTRTWFILDVMIVSIDWFEVIGSGDGSLGLLRVGKASRVFRIIRMVRLLRLLRMRDVLKVITERIQSESLIVVLSITQMTCVILGIAHLVACIWWSLGEADDNNWYTAEGLEKRSFGYRYFTSLHWSLSQFTGGMDEVRPTNVGERVYAVIAFILCFLIAAIILSSLTSSLTRLHIISSGQSKQFSVLRKYLYQNGISSKLALRIQRNATHTLIEQERSMPEKEVELLALVNEPLRIDVHSEIFSPLLSTHPFFERYIQECPQVLRKVCHVATSISLVSCGDIIFEAGEIPTDPKMYIICSGDLSYSSFHGQITQVTNGHWLSEPALWVSWMHRGVLVARNDCCRLVLLDAKKFQEIVGQFEHPDFDPCRYAHSFVKDLNHLNANNVDLTDLPLEFTLGEGKSHAATLLRQTSKLNRATRRIKSQRLISIARGATMGLNSVIPARSSKTKLSTTVAVLPSPS